MKVINTAPCCPDSTHAVNVSHLLHFYRIRSSFFCFGAFFLLNKVEINLPQTSWTPQMAGGVLDGVCGGGATLRCFCRELLDVNDINYRTFLPAKPPGAHKSAAVIINSKHQEDGFGANLARLASAQPQVGCSPARPNGPRRC